MDYRRAWHPGGTYFFTVNCLQRRNNTLLVEHIDVLRRVVKTVKTSHPFTSHAWVVFPEHLHCVIELPEGDADYKTRWMLIKMLFSKAIPKTEYLSKIRKQRRERGICGGGVRVNSVDWQHDRKAQICAAAATVQYHG